MMKVVSFFDARTFTFTYLVEVEEERAILIDPVLNYEPYSARVTTTGADQIIRYVEHRKLTLDWILETHIHADHLTASHYIKKRLGGRVGIGSGIQQVLRYWVPIFNAKDIPLDGSLFDATFEEGQEIKVGNKSIKAIHTPGHTPACVSYVMDGMAFVGDLMFKPDVGTGRADFPGGSARDQYHSIQKILAMPEHTKVFSAHDYPQKRDPNPRSTVGSQRHNIMLEGVLNEEGYIQKREQKDFGKPAPELLLPSLQVNIRAGNFEKPNEQGIRYLQIPLNQI